MKKLVFVVAVGLTAVLARGEAVRYVATNGNDTENDGLSEQAPFATIAKAVDDLGETGGTVWVADGTYVHAEIIPIKTPVTVAGASGDPAKVTIDGNSKTRLFSLAHDKACLRHLTLYRGKTASGNKVNGGNLVMSKGLVEECVLKDGAIAEWGNSGGNAYVSGGRVVRCKFIGGKCNGSDLNVWAQTGASLFADGGVVENCLITKCTHSRGPVCAGGTSKVVNCTIAGNTSDFCAGVYIKGKESKVINCIISGNSYTGKDSDTTYAVYRAFNDNYVPTTAEDAAAAFDSCLAPLAINDDCIVGDPCFKDAANGDYALADASPAVNVGLDDDKTGIVSDFDLAGNPRVYGCKVDLGAFENVTKPGIVFSTFDFSAKGGLATLTLAMAENALKSEVAVQVLRDGQIVERVNFGALVAGDVRTLQYAEPGVYSARIDASCKDYATQPWMGWCSLAGSLPVRFVSVDGNDGATGADASSAMQTVAAAVAALGDAGGKVYVMPGTYAEGGTYSTGVTNALYLTKPVEIIGVTGRPFDVVLTRKTGYSRVIKVSNAAAAVRSLTLKGGSIPTGYNDKPDQHGANLWITTNGGTVENCVISDGKADAWAGAGGNVYMQGGRLVRCTLVGGMVYDSAEYEGGSIWRYCGSSVYASGGTIEDCVIRDCASGAAPVALYDSVKMVNCTVVNNVGVYCGGVMIGGANNKVKATVVNTAIFGNIASRAAAVETDAVYRSITRSGCSVSAPETAFDHCAATLAINDLCPAVADPGFVAADKGDYRLASGSDLIDAGKDLAGGTSAYDLDGADRICGLATDIGCYENNEVPGLRFAELSLKVLGDKVVAHVAVAEKLIDSSVIVTIVHDGVVVLSEEAMPLAACERKVYEFTDPGTYSMRVTVRSGEETLVRECDWVYLAGQAGNVRFVSSGGNDAKDGLTAVTALKKIETAVTALGASGGKVYVLPGSYYGQLGTNAYHLTTPVSIIGATGKPADVTIGHGAADNKWATLARVFKVDHASASVRCVTIKDGYFQSQAPKFTDQCGKSGGNVWITSKGGTVENCIISNGTPSFYGGAGGNVYLQSGRLSNCEVIGGTVNYYGMWSVEGDSICAEGGVVENCLIRGCTNAKGGPVGLANSAKMINCTIVNNTGTASGGVIVRGSNAKVINCAVFGNSCTKDDAPALAAVCRGSVKDKAVTEDATAAAAFDHCAAELEVNSSCFVVAEPGFVDADAGDYRLLKESSLRNKGANYTAAGGVSGFDLAGFARVDRTTVDIGAYEWQRIPSSARPLMLIIR